MTNREQAKSTMYAGFDTYVNEADNLTIINGDDPCKDQKEIWDAVYAANKEAVGKTGTDNSGFSEDKLKKKKKAALACAIHAGRAQIKLIAGGYLDLAGQLFTAKTDYEAPADGAAVVRMQAAHDLMSGNIGKLTGYVTAANLTELQLLITAYADQRGSSDAAHQLEPVDTAAAQASFAPCDKCIEDFKTAGRIFIGTVNEEFYNGLVAVSVQPAVNIHHTTVNVTVRKKEDNAVIQNANGKLSNKKKESTSNFNGIMVFSEVRSGPEVLLTITAPGRKQVIMQIGIQRGKDNNFDVFMEAE